MAQNKKTRDKDKDFQHQPDCIVAQIREHVIDALMDSHNVAEEVFRVDNPTTEIVFGVFDRIYSYGIIDESEGE